jgi:hypothetical protein
LAFNIFTGIAIDEIKRLLADSNVQIMKDKITYIYEYSFYDGSSCFKRLIERLKCVFRVEDIVDNFKEFCWKIILYGEINKVNDIETTVSQERKWQEAYEDDRYSESFETLEDRSKRIENKIDRILNLKDERMGNQVSGLVPILPINDNTPSDGGFKELFKMMKKISQKQESIDMKMNSIDQKMQSQKESIAEQNKVINELAKQMVKINKNN